MARVAERRSHRRADVEGRVELRGPDGSDAPLVGRADNVSLAGVYARVPRPFPWQPGTLVSCSVNFPPEATRLFPFSRLAGRGRVVRVFDDAAKPAGGREPQEVGVAISFAADVTALGTISGY